jgi:hypothetical protein
VQRYKKYFTLPNFCAKKRQKSLVVLKISPIFASFFIVLDLRLTIRGSAEPHFFAFYDTHNTSPPYSVAISTPCRNNFDKNQAIFLESAQNPRTFASVI